MDIETKKVKNSIIGKVIANKMNKTAVVMTQRKVKHPRYIKYTSRISKYNVHDPNNLCKIGEFVRIQESRPYSKSKTWEFVEIIEQKI